MSCPTNGRLCSAIDISALAADCFSSGHLESANRAQAHNKTYVGLGRPTFGIQPARPLRILTIQAENDAGDLGEMARGVCDGLHLSAEERAAVGDRVLYVSERARTGPLFLSLVVAPLLAKHRPDILRIDPLLAYLGGDVNDAETTAGFLRTGLNPLLEEYGCAVIINHHTPKVINRDTSGWRGSDWMYAGAGSADLTNWCRAALVIDPTHAGHVFRFHAAKRGGRIGWRGDDDQRVYERLFCHDTDGGLYWREASDDDLLAVETSKPRRRSSSKTKEDLRALVPIQGAIPKAALFSLAQTNGVGGEKRLRGFLAELIATGDSSSGGFQGPRPTLK
ncbi:MAG: AAA family ATPase [Chthoniobacterales bacterium]|nr:AAA family ATPase [Chthoniobacterales bacterium]